MGVSLHAIAKHKNKVRNYQHKNSTLTTRSTNKPGGLADAKMNKGYVSSMYFGK